MKLNILTVIAFVLISIGAGFLMQRQAPFSSLSPEEKQTQLVAQRDAAIQEAVENGDYRCCINPPCTMCYMEANQWNNYTAGTCACDDLIAQGKEACPQCNRQSCESGQEEFCKQK